MRMTSRRRSRKFCGRAKNRIPCLRTGRPPRLIHMRSCCGPSPVSQVSARKLMRMPFALWDALAGVAQTLPHPPLTRNQGRADADRHHGLGKFARVSRAGHFAAIARRRTRSDTQAKQIIRKPGAKNCRPPHQVTRCARGRWNSSSRGRKCGGCAWRIATRRPATRRRLRSEVPAKNYLLSFCRQKAMQFFLIAGLTRYPRDIFPFEAFPFAIGSLVAEIRSILSDFNVRRQPAD